MSTHVHEPVITSHARVMEKLEQPNLGKVLPAVGKGIRFIPNFIFGSIGWLIGSIVFVVMYCALSLWFGVMQGAHITPRVPEAPKSPSIPR